MITKIKFKRSSEYESKDIVSNLFDMLVMNLVYMKQQQHHQNDNNNLNTTTNVDYFSTVIESILSTFDKSSLASLAVFIPRIQQLIPDIDVALASPRRHERETEGGGGGGGGVDWQQIFLLSKFVRAILCLDRNMCLFWMICNGVMHRLSVWLVKL